MGSRNPRQGAASETKRARNLFLALLLLAYPSLAQANVGTPLMWAGFLHLVLGNLIIGLFEGALLAKVFGLPWQRCTALLVVANYFSAWCGGFLAYEVGRALPVGLDSAWSWLWGLVLVAYVLTVLLEYPFVLISFGRDTGRRRKAFRGSVLVQTVSYMCLVAWYSLASGASLYTETRAVDISAIPLHEGVRVYFISADDGDVYGGSVRDGEWDKVFDLNSSDPSDRLAVWPSTQNGDRWDLVARLETDNLEEPDLVTVRETFASVAAPSPQGGGDEPVGSWANFGQVPKLGEAQESSWEFWAGFWPIDGLRGQKASSDAEVSLAFETPFFAWAVRNVTHLPGDKLLLQLGEDQVCLYDPEGARIALLARGRGPVAVMQDGKLSEASGDRADRGLPRVSSAQRGF